MKDWGWDERELVRRCKEGSEAAYAELVRQHRPRLFTLAYRLTNDRETAEDIVQEAFLAAFRAIERFELRPSLSAWLNTIAIRLAGRAAAKRRDRDRATSSIAPIVDGTSTSFAVQEPADVSQDPHLAAEAAELGRILTTAIAELPFKMRTAVVLRHVLGLDYAEAARAMDVPINTYKSHLLRGTRHLRDSLALSLADTDLPERTGTAAARHGSTGITVEAGTAFGDNNRAGRDRTVFEIPAANPPFPNEELAQR